MGGGGRDDSEDAGIEPRKQLRLWYGTGLSDTLTTLV
jgi:hypothetical protein